MDPQRWKRIEEVYHAAVGRAQGEREAFLEGACGADDGLRRLVLELVDGPTLAERITDGPLQVKEALAVARQIADALEAAHKKGIIHRDLKPANIKFARGGDVKVLDFGLAKAFAGDKS